MNEKIFITGASSGIGEALAIEYAKRGAILGLCARRTENLDLSLIHISEPTRPY